MKRYYHLSLWAMLCLLTSPVLKGQYSGSLYTGTTFDSRNINTSLPVGTLEGESEVVDGASLYTIPIFISPGTNGITPQVKLVYNSLAGDGTLGRGWSIAGLSSISRVHRSVYFDAGVDPIEINNNDRFVLDGQRLILKSGTYGGDGATYGTESENWSTIYSYGNNGYGPLKFKVVRKDGVEIEYGYLYNENLYAGSSNKILQWYMNKITYKDGNYITFHYADVNNEKVVTHIKYTGNIYSGLGVYNEVTFHYSGSRIDNNEIYIAGYGYERKNLLTRIDVTAEGSLATRYTLKYAHDNINSFLKEIERYGSDGTTRYNSTIFKYGDQPVHYQVGSSNIVQGQSVDLYSGDFDGDGYSDVLGATYAYSSGVKYTTGLKAYKRTSTSSTYSNYYNKTFSGLFQVVNDVNNPKLHTFFSTDFTGDARDDIMIHKLGYTSTGGLQLDYIYLYQSTGTSFSESTKSLPGSYVRIAANNGDGQYYFPGDYDGDGATDYLLILSNGTGFKAFISFPSNNIYNQQVSVPGYSNYLGGEWVHTDFHNVIDFDGDGKHDLMLTKGSVSKIFNFSKVGSTWTAKELHSAGFPTKWHKMLFGDFNGDGKTDMLTRGSLTNNNTPWNKAVSTGTSWIESSFTFFQAPNLTGSYSDDKVVLADFNGDGRTDIFHSYPDFNGWSASDSDTDVYYSKGVNFYRKFEDLTPLDGFSKSPPLDLNGDGKVEVINRTHYQSPFDIFYLNKDGKELLMEKVKNGLNYETQWSYKRMTETSGFFTRGTVFSGAFNSVQLPVNLVYEHKKQNGIGGWFTNRFSYKDARLDKHGKGFLGVMEITNKDLDRGFHTISTKDHYQTYHTVYLRTVELFKTSTNYKLQHDYNYVTFQNQGNNRFWLKTNYTTISKYLEDQYFKTDYTYDTYGNVTQTVENRDFVETETTNVTYGTYGTPIPAKPLVTTKTIARTGQSSYQSITRNTWNTKGQLTRRDDFDGKSKEVRNYFYYNMDGTLSETQKFTNGVSYRKNNFYYDSKGRYVTSTTNPLNQVSTKSYDKRWGAPTLYVTINGLSRSYAYDVFGKLKTSNFNIEQYSVLESYHWDVTSSGLTFYHKKTHSGEPDVKIWYDALGRERQTQTEGFQNYWVTTKKEYDSKGNLYRDYGPYKTGETSLLTTHTYDSYNRLYQQSNTFGTTTYTYTYLNTPTYYGGKVETTTTNPAGQASSQTIDGTGKMVESEDNGGILTYEYYSHGKIKDVKKSGVTLTSSEYDDYMRQTKLIDVNGGTTTYEYDAFGQLIKETNPNGQNIFMSYDQLGRMTSRVLPEGTTSYTYFPSGSGLSTNQLKKITAFSGYSEEYTYDGYGYVNNKIEYVDNAFYTTSFTNDKYGKTTQINYPSGFIAKYNFDANGFLNTIKNSTGSITLFTNEGMNGYNQYKQYKLGNNKTSYNYFNYGIPTRSYTSGIQNLYQYWDYASGNLTRRYDAYKGKNEYFQYDNLNRLTQSYGTGLQTINVAFASNGNISSKTDVGSYYYGSKINAVARVTNSQSNIPTITQDITYTSFHQPIDVTEGSYLLSYTYGGGEQRKKSVLKLGASTLNTRYYFNGFEKVVAGGNTEWLHYISTGQNIIGIVKRVGSTDTYYYTYTDHLGSIVSTTSSSGSIVAEQNFDAWGRKRNPSTWDYSSIPTNPSWLIRGYTMHEEMSEFNLINMNGRMYDPLVNRMLSVDRFVYGETGTQGFNRYTYAHNNPLRYYDPDGELPFLAIIGIGALVFGTGNVVAHAVAGDLNNFWDGLEAFGVGALAGAAITAGAYFGLSVPILGPIIQGAGYIKAATTAISVVSGLGQGIIGGDWTALGNAGEIFLGNFYSDTERSFLGQTLQLTSRHSWEFLQTEVGYNYSQLRNTFGAIDKVDLYRGVTFSQNFNANDGWGVSLGNFVNTNRRGPDTGRNIRNDGLLQHEYGHTFDSHIFGPFYLFAIGIPSAAGATWTETRADNHWLRYIARHPF